MGCPNMTHVERDVMAQIFFDINFKGGVPHPMKWQISYIVAKLDKLYSIWKRMVWSGVIDGPETCNSRQ